MAAYCGIKGTAGMSEVGLEYRRTPKAQLLVKVLLLVVALVLLNYGVSWLAIQINFQFWPRHARMVDLALLASVGLYVLLMALPFMPGIELGLVLMTMLGREGILLVYICTLVALSLSFLVGRLIPLRVVAGLLGWFRLHKAQSLVMQLQPLGPADRFELLLRNAPSKFIPFLLRHRYLVIAVALNLPGNALIGGGGGIGLIAGMSGLYSFPRYILLVSVAITPVPLILLTNLVPL